MSDFFGNSGGLLGTSLDDSISANMFPHQTAVHGGLTGPLCEARAAVWHAMRRPIASTLNP